MITTLDVLEVLDSTMPSTSSGQKGVRSLLRDVKFLDKVAAKLRKKIREGLKSGSLTENELTGDLVGFCSTTTQARGAAVRLCNVYHVLHRLPDKKEAPKVKLPPELIDHPKKKKRRRVVR